MLCCARFNATATWIGANFKQGLSWGSQAPEVHHSTEILISKRNNNGRPLGVLHLTMTTSNINKQLGMHRNKRTYSKRSFLFFLFILLCVFLMREITAPTISSPATHGRLPAEWHYKALAVNTIYRFPSRKLSTPHFGIFS